MKAFLSMETSSLLFNLPCGPVILMPKRMRIMREAEATDMSCRPNAHVISESSTANPSRVSCGVKLPLEWDAKPYEDERLSGYIIKIQRLTEDEGKMKIPSSWITLFLEQLITSKISSDLILRPILCCKKDFQLLGKQMTILGTAFLPSFIQPLRSDSVKSDRYWALWKRRKFTKHKHMDTSRYAIPS